MYNHDDDEGSAFLPLKSGQEASLGQSKNKRRGPLPEQAGRLATRPSPGPGPELYLELVPLPADAAREARLLNQLFHLLHECRLGHDLALFICLLGEPQVVSQKEISTHTDPHPNSGTLEGRADFPQTLKDGCIKRNLCSWLLMRAKTQIPCYSLPAGPLKQRNHPAGTLASRHLPPKQPLLCASNTSSQLAQADAL